MADEIAKPRVNSIAKELVNPNLHKPEMNFLVNG